MDRKIPDLQQESLKNHPFGVPEGYFESFSERLHERIKAEEKARVPIRRIKTTNRILALAAAILAAALITTSIIHLSTSDRSLNVLYPEVALLDEMQVFENDLYYYDLLEEEQEVLDEEEAFASQAIEYLAINDVEMDLIFE